MYGWSLFNFNVICAINFHGSIHCNSQIGFFFPFFLHSPTYLFALAPFPVLIPFVENYFTHRCHFPGKSNYKNVIGSIRCATSPFSVLFFSCRVSFCCWWGRYARSYIPSNVLSMGRQGSHEIYEHFLCELLLFNAEYSQKSYSES